MVQVLQMLSGGRLAELVGATVPGGGASRIAGRPADTGLREKGRIERGSKPQCRAAITDVCGAFVI
jgi:hypothetical protein